MPFLTVMPLPFLNSRGVWPGTYPGVNPAGTNPWFSPPYPCSFVFSSSFFAVPLVSSMPTAWWATFGLPGRHSTPTM